MNGWWLKRTDDGVRWASPCDTDYPHSVLADQYYGWTTYPPYAILWCTGKLDDIAKPNEYVHASLKDTTFWKNP